MELIKLLFLNFGKILDFFLSQKQKNLIDDALPENNFDPETIVCSYDKIENKMATGVLFFKNFEIAFKSGGYGKGQAPKGKYNAHTFMNIGADFPNADAYSLFGIGFFVHIDSIVSNDRFDLGIHFDGNVPGTLGCIGLQCSNLEDAIKVKNLFRDAFDTKKEIPCEII
jgi:hypothetical protein